MTALQSESIVSALVVTKADWPEKQSKILSRVYPDIKYMLKCKTVFCFCTW